MNRKRYFRSAAHEIEFDCAISCNADISDLVAQAVAPYFTETAAKTAQLEITFRKACASDDAANEVPIMTDDRECKIYWNPKNNSIRHARQEGNVFYIFGDSEVEIATDMNDKISTSLIARSIYISFIVYCRSLGFRHLHGSAAAFNGKTYLFLGDRHVGKTTFLLSCLSRGWDLVSNDQVLLFSTSQNIQAIGLPISARVREGTVRMFSNLLLEFGAKDIVLPIARLADNFRTAIKPVSPLEAIIVLRRGESADTRFLRVDNKKIARQIIRNHEFRMACEHQPFWMECEPAVRLNLDVVPLFAGLYLDQEHTRLIEAIESYDQLSDLKQHLGATRAAFKNSSLSDSLIIP